MKLCESEKHQSWCMKVEGFRGQVATDGSLIGKTGKWIACGWAVVQLDYDEEMEPLYGMYGSMDAEYEVQRTIKRGGADGHLMFSQESDRTQQSASGQQGNF